MRQISLLLFLLFSLTLSSQNMGPEVSFVREHHIGHDILLLPPANGIRVGYSLMDGSGSMSNVMYAGVGVTIFIPSTDTFTAQSSGGFSTFIPGKRVSHFYSIALRMNFPLPLNTGEFFRTFGGLDAGFMGGSSNYTYEFPNAYTHLSSDYPAPGKDPYRNFLINFYLGANYEFENFSVFAQGGYRLESLSEYRGDPLGAITMEVGIHYHLKSL
jgi:hypothetical protein